LCTLGKVIELYVLYVLGAGLLTWVVGLNWFYFFISALVLQSMELSRGYRRDFETNNRCDILAGQLPSTRSPAGACKILLGLPGNFRRHIFWRIVWFFGIAVGSVSVVACYMLLSTAGPKAAYTWIGFQVFWLVCRSIFYHVSEATSKDIYPNQKGQKWDNLSQSMRRRVLKLLTALSKYQTHVHPRGSYAYAEDVRSVDEVQDLLAQCTFMEEYPLEEFHPVEKMTATIDIKVHAMIGDTLMSSVAWFCGSKHTPIELYDTSILFLEVPSDYAGDEKQRLLAIPVVRVVSSIPSHNPQLQDVESVGRDTLDEEMCFSSPKGSNNKGIHDIMWVTFIPCGGGRWIEAMAIDMKMLWGSPRSSKVMTNEELTERLESGYWNISLEKAEMVYDTLILSRKTAETVVELFGAGLGVSVDRRPKAS
jgi:hypothetical protein